MRDGNNIREIEAAHPSMMGFICWKGSSRNVTVKPSYLPNCIRVGVFVNPSENEILRAKEMLNLNYIQLHGNESSTLCRRIKETMNLKLIKAISVESESDIQKSEPYHGIADMIVFDTKCVSYGGSGNKFDWDVLHAYTGPTPFLLSGGIGPQDWHRIREWNHPYCIGIDINSRFESAPAMKDAKAFITFINQIRQIES